MNLLIDYKIAVKMTNKWQLNTLPFQIQQGKLYIFNQEKNGFQNFDSIAVVGMHTSKPPRQGRYENVNQQSDLVSTVNKSTQYNILDILEAKFNALNITQTREIK